MDYIFQMEHWFGSEEREALNQYMDEGGWLTEFKKTDEFEKNIAKYTNAKHCIVVNNGTISLTLMAFAADLKYGDEVIIPNYTMIATPNSIKMFGAKPVFVDVEEETLCMDLEAARNAITNKTKAILYVNANGRNPNHGIKAYHNLCKENNLIFLEDAAQSLGSYFTDGRHQGTVGLAGSFSFSPPKIISTGQGGAIVTDNDAMAYRLKRLKDFGRSGGGIDIHDSIGYNSKFTDLQAVIGIEQMKKLQWRVERKKDILRLYKKQLLDCKDVKFFVQDLSCTTPWFIDVLVSDRDKLRDYLKGKQIGTRLMYPPLNKQIAYQISGYHPVSELIGEKGLWLPSAAQLTDKQICYICEQIKQFYAKP